MNRRWLLLALLLATLLIGCGPSWIVVRRASPNPYPRHPKFGVAAVDFTGLRVGDKTEVDYLGEKDSGQQASFKEDKAALSDRFASGLIARAQETNIQIAPGMQGAQFIIRPTVLSIEPGWFAGIVGRNSRVEMVLRITLPDGRILDEVIIAHQTGAGVMTASSGERLRQDGTGLGRIAAEYLKSRLGLDE